MKEKSLIKINTTDPFMDASTLSINKLISRLHQNIEWQKLTFGNIDLLRSQYIIDAYQGIDRKDKVIFNSDNYTRYVVQMPVYVNDFDLYIIGWDAHQMSAIHDHADNGCVMKFLQGTIIEKRFIRHNKEFLLSQENTYHAGETAYIPGHTGYHSIGNATNLRGVSLHVYSPPHWQTTSYDT